jgi:hypothetical protein
MPMSLTIVGVQTGAWIVLLALSFTNLQWKDLAEANKIGPLLLVAVAILYPAGIVVDEIADWLSRPQVERIKRKVRRKRGLTFDPEVFGLLLRAKDPFAKQYFEYLRARIRLCRSTALNSFMTAVAAVFFIIFRSRPSWFGPTVLALGVPATVSAAFAWIRVSETFAKKAAQLGAFIGWPPD